MQCVVKPSISVYLLCDLEPLAHLLSLNSLVTKEEREVLRE